MRCGSQLLFGQSELLRELADLPLRRGYQLVTLP
jgi:hypothetical protein